MSSKIKFLLWTVLYLCIYIYSDSASASIIPPVIHIVAAENIYGNVAKELGGAYVDVTNIINSPNQDPHLFTTSPSTAIAITKANIIIYNGADYDPWMKALLGVQDLKNNYNNSIIIVSELMGIKKGENPHIWYNPETIPKFSQKLVSLLIQLDPAHAAYFQHQLELFHKKYQPIFKIIQDIKQQYPNTSVIATEPVFNYMADSFGFHMYGQAFQLSLMNDIPPTISQIKQFQEKLYHHTVQIVIFNKQVMNPIVRQMLAIARQEKIACLGVTEMLPNHTSYVQWMMAQLVELKGMLTP